MDVLAGAPAMPCDAAGPSARWWDNVPATASWRQRTLTSWQDHKRGGPGMITVDEWQTVRKVVAFTVVCVGLEAGLALLRGLLS